MGDFALSVRAETTAARPARVLASVRWETRTISDRARWGLFSTRLVKAVINFLFLVGLLPSTPLSSFNLLILFCFHCTTTCCHTCRQSA